jgi:hypothetical protein
MSLELRAVIRFFSLKHAPNQPILSELRHVSGKDLMSLRDSEKWDAAFDGGRTEFADLPMSEKPHDTGKVNPVRALIEGEGYLSQKNITQILGTRHEIAERIFHNDLNTCKMNFTWLRMR